MVENLIIALSYSCGVTGRPWIYFTWFCPSGVSSDGSGRHVEQRQVESAVMEVAGFISLYLKFLNTTRRQRKQFQGGDWRWMAVGFNLEPSPWKCWPWEFSVDSVEKSNLSPLLLAVCGGCCQTKHATGQMPYHGAVLQFCVLGLLGVKTKSMM